MEESVFIFEKIVSPWIVNIVKRLQLHVGMQHIKELKTQLGNFHQHSTLSELTYQN